jgi:flagellar basal body-associated protein FliL
MELISNIKGKERNNWVNSYKRKQKFIYIFILIFLILLLLTIIFAFIFIKRKESNHNGNKIISNSFTLYPNYIEGISGEDYTIALESNERKNCLKPKYIKFLIHIV